MNKKNLENNLKKLFNLHNLKINFLYNKIEINKK